MSPVASTEIKLGMTEGYKVSTPDDLPSRLRERLKALRIFEREASRRAGFSPSYVGDLITGRSKNPELSRIQKLADVLDCDLDYLMGNSDVPRRIRPGESASFAPAEARSRLIDLYSSRPADDGVFGELTGEAIDRVPALPALAHVADAYALAINTPLMEPRYLVGEIVYIHPGLPPRPLDFVLTRLRDGRAVVAQLDSSDSEKVSLRLLSMTPEAAARLTKAGITVDANTLVLPRSEVAQLHRIIGSAS